MTTKGEATRKGIGGADTVVADRRNPSTGLREGGKALQQSQNGMLEQKLRTRDASAIVENVTWIRVAQIRKPCNECGELKNFVEHPDGQPYSWRMCWKHLKPGAVLIRIKHGERWP